MTATGGREGVVDYAGFDFAALWPGRERVTEVESAILKTVLRPGDCRRILEVGTGFGRLLGTLASLSDEVVASDFDLAALVGVPATHSRRTPLRVAANLYHLPFGPGAFTAATMVRVYHHLSDPVAALKELCRVLRAGSRLVVSYNPKPSVGTFVNDVQRAIHSPISTRFRTITFSPGSTVLDPDPFPVYVAGRREFAREVASAGLRAESEVVSGLEEYYLMRYLPARWFVRFGTMFGRAPAFPSRFAIVAKEGAETTALPPIEDALACPRCGAPQASWGRGASLRCRDCSFEGRRYHDVLDLRFVPDGAVRWSVNG